jgi:hypothetical protein
VAVDREYLSIERVEKYAAGYFGTDSRKRTEKRFGFLIAHVPKRR